MLQVTKILEGGVDLQTGSELPRCIVISNGVQEAAVAIDEDELMSVMRLYAGLMEGAAQEVVNSIPKPPQEEYPEELFKAPVPMPAPGPSATPFDEEPPPSSDFPEEEEFEADESYDDTGTGVGSL